MNTPDELKSILMTESEPIRTPYDDIIYPEAAFAQSHPDRLATLGLLLGMEPAPIENCRVLELGCGTGGNLIPMAYQYPNSVFIGIDYAASQIDVARAAASAINLTNIEFLAKNFLDVTDESLGEFDYIIAHGIYSWVPRAVQEKMLDLYKKHLAPNGIAYISYNTLPGWRMYGVGREMMMYRIRNITDYHERSRVAREFFNFIANIPKSLDSDTHWSQFMNAFSILLQSQASYLQQKPDEMFVHDELEYNNEALYFYQFMERAEAAGLQFLSESYFPYSVLSNFPENVRDFLGSHATNIIELEQFLDFFRNRTFRQTLLVHDNVQIERRVKPQQLAKLLITSPMVQSPAQPEDGVPNGTKFATRSDELSFVSNDAITVASFSLLTEAYPAEYGLVELAQASRATAYAYQIPPKSLEEDIQSIAANVLQSFGRAYEMVELRASPCPMTIELSEYPTASLYARFQAQTSKVVTNQRHERVNLDETTRFVLLHMDGTNTMQDITNALERAGVAPKNHTPKEIREGYAKEVNQIMGYLARSALIVG